MDPSDRPPGGIGGFGRRLTWQREEKKARRSHIYGSSVADAEASFQGRGSKQQTKKSCLAFYLLRNTLRVEGGFLIVKQRIR